MRQLASIQKIKNITPIEGADNILKAEVLGWECVINKNDNFKPGDLCVYVEIDSVFPVGDPMFAFMKPRNYRVRTARFKGQISQGICFPLNILPIGTDLEEDNDVTKELGIIKYEKPIPGTMRGKIKGNYPDYIVPKTDETRVQILEKIILANIGTEMYITEKVDGTSFTVFINNGEFGVCSRNWEKIESDECAYWQCAKKFNIQEKLTSLNMDIAIQGELISPTISGSAKNPLKVKEMFLFLFNVWNIKEQRYFDYEDFIYFAQQLNLITAPLIETNFILNHSVRELVEMAKGTSKINPQIQREGIVFRSKKEMWIDKLGRMSFKSINPIFLLKYE